MPDIHLRTPCYPTENRDLVVQAILKLFPDAEVSGESEIIAEAKSLEVFGEIIKRQRIRDAARSVMKHGIRDHATRFRLNKQVAAIGKVSFSDELHALGDIDVVIESDEIEAVIDSVAPDTRREGGR